MVRTVRIVDLLIAGDYSDIREVFRALPGQESALLAVKVMSVLKSLPDGEALCWRFESVLISS